MFFLTLIVAFCLFFFFFSNNNAVKHKYTSEVEFLDSYYYVSFVMSWRDRNAEWRDMLLISAFAAENPNVET